MNLLSPNALVKFQKDWNTAKVTQDWTQAKMAEALKISQPSFNQYLKGKIPLNTEFLIQYSKIRRIDPVTVGLEEGLSRIEVDMIAIPVMFSTAGLTYNGEITIMVASVPSQDGKLFLVEIDSDFTTLPKGAYLICSSDKVHAGALVVARKNGAVLTGTLKKTPDGWAVIQPLASGDTATLIDVSWKLNKVTGLHFPTSEIGEEFGA
jgi:transcriptional regulator with XRE-family HTH domain